MTFIGDDDVEGFDGDVGVVFDRRLLFEHLLQTGDRGFVIVLAHGVVAEHGVQALDCADADAGRGIDGVALQALDDEFLGELVVVVGGFVLLELFFRLFGQVATIDEKQHAARTAELDQAVDLGDGGVGLARAGGHLQQRARAVVFEG